MRQCLWIGDARGLACVMGAWLAIGGLLLEPRVARAGCQLLQVAEIPVEISDRRALIPGGINGQPIKMMLDTGAAVSFIQRAAVGSLGLSTRDLPHTKIFGLGGETRVEETILRELQFDKAKLKDVRVYVAGEHPLGGDFALLLGENVLSSFTTEFDFANHVMRLFSPRDCKASQLPYWANSYSQVKMTGAVDLDGQIKFMVQLNGKPLEATLDSGAPRSAISVEAARAAGWRPEAEGSVATGKTTGIGARAADSWISRFDMLAIGGEDVKHPQLWITTLKIGSREPRTGSHLSEETTLPMLLGIDFFLSHRILVSPEHGVVLFTYNGGPIFDLPARPTSTAAAH